MMTNGYWEGQIFLSCPHTSNGFSFLLTIKYCMFIFKKLEDLMALKRSPDLLNNVKIGQDQLQLIMKHILFYGGCDHFRQVT